MCGFVAHFPGRGGRVDEARLRAMNGDLFHRGPDDEGYYFGGWLGLAHRRLSIIDPSDAGHQPMFTADRRYAIAYNGEIYNYKTLRADLEAGGARFRSDTDTEVVLQSYVRWGPRCLEKFVGMYAFVVVDLQRRRAFAARDQLGIKPLYYCQTPDGLLLASEPKAFRHVVGFELNQSALYAQLLYRYVPGRETIFRNVFRLDAGSYLDIDHDAVFKLHRYYDVTDAIAERSAHPPDLRDIDRNLRGHIEAHTQSDVGYNVQLSGGLDSSYITAVLAREGKRRLTTYSVSLDSEFDESRYQRYVSDAFGTDHHDIRLDSRDLADGYARATWHMDFPIVHVACVFLMLLCDRSRTHSKVILTGEGADELFSGYSRYRLGFPMKLVFALGRAGVRPWMIPRLGKLATLRSLLGRDVVLGAQAGLAEDELEHHLVSVAKTTDCLTAPGQRFPDLLRKMIAIDQTAYLTSMLERQDRMSMAAAVESRVPFCVFSMFDTLNHSPPRTRLRNGEPKSILKTLAEKYFPREFVYRRKNGFVLPLDTWLRDDKGFGRFLDLLGDRRFRERGFFAARSVADLVDRQRRGENHAKLLVRLISFELWHRMFIDRSISPPVRSRV